MEHFLSICETNEITATFTVQLFTDNIIDYLWLAPQSAELLDLIASNNIYIGRFKNSRRPNRENG